MRKLGWAYRELPCPMEDLGDLSQWKVIGDNALGEAIQLLDDLFPFVGYEANVPDLKERLAEFIKRYQWALTEDES